MPQKPVSARGITESQFYMWRTLFSIAHADGTVSEGERRFMEEALTDIPFTAAQKETLRADIATPQDPGAMFARISDRGDQARFFRFAQKLVWADGQYSQAEQKIMLQLQSEHIRDVNVDDLIGSVELEFEDERRSGNINSGSMNRDRSARAIVHSFREHFLKNRFGAA